jgi:hypothetical protein
MQLCQYSKIYLDYIVLTINDTHITDTGLRYLREFPNLQSLSLDGKQLTDDGSKHLMQIENWLSYIYMALA